MATAWAPSPAQVKALMPSRVNGQPFDNDTNPSINEVNTLIRQVVVEIQSEVGPFNPDRVINPDAHPLDRVKLSDVAQWAATLGAAYYVEQGFFPEQNNAGGEDSPAARFFARYEQQRARLVTLVQQLAPADAGGYVGSVRAHLPDGGPWVPDVR